MPSTLSTVPSANRLRGWSELPHRQVRAPVHGYQQSTVLPRQAPWPAPADRIRTLAPQNGHQLAELARAQPCEGGYPGRLRCRKYTGHTKIISCGGHQLDSRLSFR